MMCAMLSGDPWCLKPHEIGWYDPWYVQNILFYPKDDKQQLIIFHDEERQDGPQGPEEEFFARYRAHRFPEYRIKQMWAEEEARLLEATKPARLR
jgi:hypothetical protein